MTPTDPFRSLPYSSKHTVLLDRLNHVLRASGEEAAIASKQRANGTLVKPHHSNADGLNELKEFPHRQC